MDVKDWRDLSREELMAEGVKQKEPAGEMLGCRGTKIKGYVADGALPGFYQGNRLVIPVVALKMLLAALPVATETITKSRAAAARARHAREQKKQQASRTSTGKRRRVRGTDGRLVDADATG